MQITKPTKAEVMRELKDYVFITFGLISYAMGWAAFLIPYQITTGGTTGIGAIIYYATGFPIQWSYFIINAVLMTFAIKILGPKFSIKTTFAIFGLTFFLWFFQLLVNGADGVPPQILGPGQDFMACLIGAAMCGAGLGVVFNCNGSTGGTDIIAAIIHKYRDVTLGRMIMALRRYHHQFLLLHIQRLATGDFRFCNAVRHRHRTGLYRERCASVGTILYLFQRVRKDCRPHHQRDSSRCNRTRRYRLVQQTQRESIGCVGLQTPVCRDIPSGQGHRPECFHLSKLRYRRVWRRIR